MIKCKQQCYCPFKQNWSVLEIKRRQSGEERDKKWDSQCTLTQTRPLSTIWVTHHKHMKDTERERERWTQENCTKCSSCSRLEVWIINILTAPFTSGAANYPAIHIHYECLLWIIKPRNEPEPYPRMWIMK